MRPKEYYQGKLDEAGEDPERKILVFHEWLNENGWYDSYANSDGDQFTELFNQFVNGENTNAVQ